MAEARPRFGDRVERSIEAHAEVEREIARGEAEAPAGRGLVKRGIWLVITGVSLYLVAPSVLEVFGSADQITRLGAGWLGAMVVLQILSTVCLWALQRAAVRAPWFAIGTSQLASNGLSKVAPGGGAVGAALQYKMLVAAGVDRGAAVSGLTAANLLTFAVVLALPLMAIPAIVRGAVDRSLVEAAITGVVVFLLLFALGAASVASDAPLRWAGRAVQAVRNRVRRGAEPLTGLPTRLLHERDRIVGRLGPRWKRALAATIGRWGFDYLTLLAALAAVGSRPTPAVVLLAFCAAQLLAQIPVTPGGLGFVEAGLTATLGLAGVSAGNAVLATLAYRLASYWLPLPVGLGAFAVHRRRYGDRG